MTGRRPRLRDVASAPGDDPVTRRQRFRRENPEVVIVGPLTSRWHAIIPPPGVTMTEISGRDLAELMDQAEAIRPPRDDGGTPEPELTPGQRHVDDGHARRAARRRVFQGSAFRGLEALPVRLHQGE